MCRAATRNDVDFASKLLRSRDFSMHIDKLWHDCVIGFNAKRFSATLLIETLLHGSPSLADAVLKAGADPFVEGSLTSLWDRTVPIRILKDTCMAYRWKLPGKKLAVCNSALELACSGQCNDECSNVVKRFARAWLTNALSSSLTRDTISVVLSYLAAFGAPKEELAEDLSRRLAFLCVCDTPEQELRQCQPLAPVHVHHHGSATYLTLCPYACCCRHTNRFLVERVRRESVWFHFCLCLHSESS